MRISDWSSDVCSSDLNKHLPLIAPTYRYGFSTTARALDGMVEYFAGGDDNALFLYPDGFVSADVASLAGRLSAAASRGEQGRLELSPSLLARRDQFAILERERPRAMKEFFAHIQEIGRAPCRESVCQYV